MSAISELTGRRGTFETPYDGQIYIVDAITNNPGAAGGVMTDYRGQWLGMIGKELRDARTGDWINFAIPIDQLRESALDIMAGKSVIASEASDRQPAEPMTAELLGFSLVANLLNHTPPFVEWVAVDSPARRAGLQPDDLVVEIEGQLTPSFDAVLTRLSQIDRDQTIRMLVQRNSKFVSMELSLAR